MGRTKEFDRETALKEAIPVFANYGYAGTSTSVLLRAMSARIKNPIDLFIYVPITMSLQAEY